MNVSELQDWDGWRSGIDIPLSTFAPSVTIHHMIHTDDFVTVIYWEDGDMYVGFAQYGAKVDNKSVCLSSYGIYVEAAYSEDLLVCRLTRGYVKGGN